MRVEGVQRGRSWEAVRALTVTPYGHVTFDGVWRHYDGDMTTEMTVRDHLGAATGLTVVEGVARAFAVAEPRARAGAPADPLYILFGLQSLHRASSPTAL